MRATLTLRQVAEELGVSVPTVAAAIRAGQIYAIRVGHRLRVPREALEQLLAMPRGVAVRKKPDGSR